MRGLMFALVAMILSTPAVASPPVFVAIIIDDVGNNLTLGERAIALPGQVTYSVLPFTPFGPDLARRAHGAGKEVMLHEPMANISGTSPGPGALTIALSHGEFVRRFESALNDVPFVSGVNNHEGSFLTQQSLQMNWLMAEIRKRQLYFIDSRTTPRTIALRVARQNEVKSSKRNVFLDDVLTFYAIDHQFRELIRIAHEDGTAIAIGHPHALTLQYLAMAIPQLQAAGVHIIPASSLIALQQYSQLQYASGQTPGGSLPR